MAKEKSMEGMRQMIFPYFSLTYGKLNELQLSNLEQMKFHSTFCQPIHWVVLAFSHREPSRHSFWRPPGCSLFLYENPWRKIMRNEVPQYLLSTDPLGGPCFFSSGTFQTLLLATTWMFAFPIWKPMKKDHEKCISNTDGYRYLPGNRPEGN